MDQGFSLGFLNKWGKDGVYDNVTQVPFMIRMPGNLAFVDYHKKLLETGWEIAIPGSNEKTSPYSSYNKR